MMISLKLIKQSTFYFLPLKKKINFAPYNFHMLISYIPFTCRFSFSFLSHEIHVLKLHLRFKIFLESQSNELLSNMISVE